MTDPHSRSPLTSQLLRIIKAGTSEGFSPVGHGHRREVELTTSQWFLLLGATSSASGMLNILVVQWPLFRCCTVIASALGLTGSASDADIGRVLEDVSNHCLVSCRSRCSGVSSAACESFEALRAQWDPDTNGLITASCCICTTSRLTSNSNALYRCLARRDRATALWRLEAMPRL